jgi:aldehyde dehydrogenase (NAD+)
MSTNIVPESPPRYADFTKQYIGGEWREGRSSSHVIEDTNPFDGSVIARIRGASVEDVSEAYRCAERAQLGWAVSSPRERSTILRRAADLILRRRDEIIEASIREVGGVRKFAEIVWYFAWSILDTASTYPFRAAGQIVPTDSQGEESLVYREPLGVIGIISPWNSPINLTI